MSTESDDHQQLHQSNDDGELHTTDHHDECDDTALVLLLTPRVDDFHLDIKMGYGIHLVFVKFAIGHNVQSHFRLILYTGCLSIIFMVKTNLNLYHSHFVKKVGLLPGTKLYA